MFALLDEQKGNIAFHLGSASVYISVILVQNFFRLEQASQGIAQLLSALLHLGTRHQHVRHKVTVVVLLDTLEQLVSQALALNRLLVLPTAEVHLG